VSKHFKIRREAYIGAIVVVVFALFLWGISFLKSDTMFNKHNTYIGMYDRVNGLVVDNPVLINGLKVGKVKELGLCPSKGNKVFVEILMLKKVDIPHNSSMIITSSDLLGAKSVEIELGDSKILAKSGDTLNTGSSKSLKEEVSMQVLPLKKKAEELLSSFDSLIGNIQTVLNQDTKENLKRSFESIRWTLSNIEQTSYNVDTLVRTEKNRMKRILENIDAITGNIKNNESKLNNIIDNFSAISDTLAKSHISNTITGLNKTLSDISVLTDKINKGHGTLGLLINNDSLYNNLKSSSADLDRLLEDMRLNPKRYVHFSVFGGGSGKNKYTSPKPKLQP
jgi:phospholipid/cholesterol/gamma-HCH transport system substrate-binding protein